MRCSASHDAALKDSAAFLKHQAELPAMLAEKARGKGWLIEPFSRNFVTSLEQSTLPLFGLTFVAKGNIKVRGLPCTFGLKVPAIAHCDNDGAIIKYFEDLGATLTGITNLDEGCLTHLGENPHYGTIQNPRDPNLRALGTSGGSAAVVAADLADFSIGSDYGGSVRAPAAAMNIVGLKTSAGFLPSEGSFLYDPQMDTLGLLTERLEDLLFIVRKTENSTKFSQVLIPSHRSLSRVSKEIAEHFVRATEYLVTLGAKLTSLPDEIFDEAIAARKFLAPAHLESVLAKAHLASPLTNSMLALLALKKQLSPSEQTKAENTVAKIQESIGPYLENGGVIFTPSLPYLPLRTVQEDAKTPFNYFFALANVLGAPAISFPHGPYSLHLIGKTGADIRLVQSASLIGQTTNIS